MNEPRVVESVTNECQSLGRAHESSSARAEQLIACLEGEIAKRDAIIYDERIDADLQRQELDAANSNLAGLRAELAAIKAQEPALPKDAILVGRSELALVRNALALDCEQGRPVRGEMLEELDASIDRFDRLPAAPVSEAKAQGVVMSAREVITNTIGFEFLPGELQTVNSDDLVALVHAARLNAAPVQQVSVPDDFVCDSKPLQELLNATAMLLETPCQDSATYWAAQLANVEQLLAAPAEPAADASDVLDQAMYTLISIGYHENSGLVHELRQALAASRAKGVV